MGCGYFLNEISLVKSVGLGVEGVNAHVSLSPEHAHMALQFGLLPASFPCADHSLSPLPTPQTPSSDHCTLV